MGRSEALFSSYKDAPGTSESLIQDSLTTEDFNYSEGLAVNKNNYTLTFSGHTSISSQAQPQEYTNTHGGSLPNKDDVSERYTTWSNMVMLLNTKFSSEEDFKKFSGFVIGLLNMSCLHIWFSKLKWSLDVLLRFYERHAFICALHKETKLLFDELNFCLQRLYSIPFHVDMPFNDSILEEITTAEVYKKREHCQNCACTRAPTTGSEGSSCFTSNTGTNTIGSGGSRPDSADSSRTSRSSKSRIPRPISLPKRLEDKLSIRASRSPQRASSAGGNFNAKSNVK